MKKAFAILLSMVLIIGLAACSGGDGGGSAPESSSPGAPDTAGGGEAAAAELDYPKGNVTCIIPYGAGGTMDMLSRALFESLPEGEVPSGVNFLVDNVAGGGGLVGTEQGLTKAADGYTIVGINGDLIINRAIGATDIVLHEDFIPIVCLQDEPYCLIGPAEGELSTLEGFIERAQSGDNAVTVGITGLGSPGGLAAVALSDAFGSQIKTVTYDASSDCALAVVSGEVDATFAPVTVVAGQIEAGQLKVLAVTTAQESPTLPGVPSIAKTYPEECGDLDLRSYCMLGAIAGTDDAIVEYLADLFNKAVASEKYAELTESMYMTPAVVSVQEMIDYSSNAYDFYMGILED